MPETNWTLTGNAEVNPAENFLGTTSQQPLVIRTNGVEIMRITAGRSIQVNGFRRLAGNVGIGTPEPDAKLHVSSGSHFNSPQAKLVQTIPAEFARLRFVSFKSDPVNPENKVPFPAWDIASGQGVLNFFVPDAGNVLSLSGNGTATVRILEITGGNDITEHFPVDGDKTDIEPGTVMIIDEGRPGSLKISDRAYDRKVAGVVSGGGGMNAGLALGGADESGTQVALAGRVYCKAEAFSSAIETGCMLTTSNIPGHAMRAANLETCHGAILGKAMTPLEAGRGLVLALVNLQ